jgi:hypothetical protein
VAAEEFDGPGPGGIFGAVSCSTEARLTRRHNNDISQYNEYTLVLRYNILFSPKRYPIICFLLNDTQLLGNSTPFSLPLKRMTPCALPRPSPLPRSAARARPAPAADAATSGPLRTRRASGGQGGRLGSGRRAAPVSTRRPSQCRARRPATHDAAASESFAVAKRRRCQAERIRASEARESRGTVRRGARARGRSAALRATVGGQLHRG